MAKTINQKILFKNAKAKDLYDLYMNSKKHSKATGAPAVISSKEGGSYSAHNGWITGENLKLVKDQLILQTWRGKSWSEKTPDSIFMIFLEPKGKNVVLHAVHSNIPDKEYEGINKGWHQHYWEPWKKYLSGKAITESIKM
jgi:activator of HSP90 ATPase